MELNVKGSFDRDVIAYTNTKLLVEIYKAIENVKNVKSIAQINNLKKLDNYDVYYRIKISSSYK